MGPLLARRGRAMVAPPGGDFPTRRTIRTHLEALAHMGVRVSEAQATRSKRLTGSSPRRTTSTKRR